MAEAVSEGFEGSGLAALDCMQMDVPRHSGVVEEARAFEFGNWM